VDNTWTPEKIEYFKSASGYTGFHEKLSALAEPYLDESWTLADIGCGLGLLDCWLAHKVACVEAIDIDEAAIADLKARIEGASPENRKTAGNIKPRVASLDELALAGESWDAVMLSFFGLNEESLEKVLALAKRRVFIFTHGRPDAEGPLAALDDGNKLSAAETEAFLRLKGYTYEKGAMETQFGQPFKTPEEIHAFLNGYICEREQIIKTNRMDYPYYLPKSISVVLFIINMEGEK